MASGILDEVPSVVNDDGSDNVVVVRVYVKDSVGEKGASVGEPDKENVYARQDNGEGSLDKSANEDDLLEDDDDDDDDDDGDNDFVPRGGPFQVTAAMPARSNVVVRKVKDATVSQPPPDKNSDNLALVATGNTRDVNTDKESVESEQ